MNGKNISKLISLLFIILTMLFSCDTTTTTDKTAENTLDYNSYPEDYSIIVSNMSSERLVLFKNDLIESNMIGAIGKYEQNHYLKKDKKLFSKTASFRLVAITEDDYLKNKDNLYSLTNNPFTRVYAFYNAAGTNETVYKISADLVGEYKMTIQNSTTYHVELRKNSINGEVIGFASAMSADTVLYLNDGTYTIFPVFIKYNKLKDSLFEVIPRYSDTAENVEARGKPKADFFTLGDGEAEEQEHVFMASKFKNNEYPLISGSAYVTVINESGVAVQLKKGTSVVRTNTGSGETIASGKSYTYEIPFPQRADGSYPKEYEVSKGVYQIGTSLYYTDIKGFNFVSDTMYELRVTGEDAANLIASEISNPVTINWDSLEDNSFEE